MFILIKKKSVYMTVGDCSEPYDTFQKTMQDHRGPYWSIKDQNGPRRTIGDHMGP